ncbi:TetR/AcrR family transcriptional regulator [Nocardia cerradoensis]|uniref:HTH-type transcriptional repressor FabR n=1 Tax=Nocardia cerradoensis TaxID=85688 RepID=A0A231H061_9NOCA|nr:TetR/AcrR family transcriptional regulator [Nocardia cerradoensis]NKY42056.1 TetR family transcriptional regulator [Nocardia cerradoensis]OXR42253.1 HTH-type transcriptional repressor FabR [Nocardia cerradoensis]
MSRRTHGKQNKRSLDEEGGRPRAATAQRTQAQRRHESRSAIIEAALELIAGGEAFEALSLRKIATTAGLAPSAFYRYFESLDALGIAIIEESFRRLKKLLASMDPPAPGEADTLLSDLVDVVGEYTRQEYSYIAFVARERIAGSATMRRVIRTEIRVMINQMATVLARTEPVNRWPIKDTKMLATLLVTVLIVSLDSSLDVLSVPARRDDPDALVEVNANTKMQLAYLLDARSAWRPGRREAARKGES